MNLSLWRHRRADRAGVRTPGEGVLTDWKLHSSGRTSEVRMKILPWILAGVFLAAAAAPALAQSDSQTRAAALVTRLGSEGPTAFAAAVPDTPTRFVAALHMPGVQLLVISGDYQSPALLRELMLKNDYRRVYMDLNSAADRDGRFFVEDLGADGLRRERENNAAFDITWRNGTVRTLYNGDWDAQDISREEYQKRFDQDAAEYAQLLQVLLTAHAAKETSQR